MRKFLSLLSMLVLTILLNAAAFAQSDPTSSPVPSPTESIDPTYQISSETPISTTEPQPPSPMEPEPPSSEPPTSEPPTAPTACDYNPNDPSCAVNTQASGPAVSLDPIKQAFVVWFIQFQTYPIRIYAPKPISLKVTGTFPPFGSREWNGLTPSQMRVRFYLVGPPIVDIYHATPTNIYHEVDVPASVDWANGTFAAETEEMVHSATTSNMYWEAEPVLYYQTSSGEEKHNTGKRVRINVETKTQ
jgi:hypothetical protein